MCVFLSCFYFGLLVCRAWLDFLTSVYTVEGLCLELLFEGKVYFALPQPVSNLIYFNDGPTYIVYIIFVYMLTLGIIQQ